MKKLLGIVVLGLLWLNICVANDRPADFEIVDIPDPRTLGLRSGDPKNRKARRLAVEICTSKNKFTYQFSSTMTAEDGYTLKKIRYYCSAEDITIDPLWGQTYTWKNYFTGAPTTLSNVLIFDNYNPSKFKEWKKNDENVLVKIKDMCLTFGYREGTEKFADCMKDMYLKETKQEKIVINTNDLNTQRSIDPSVSDDLGKISEDLLGGKSISEALGGVSSSSGSRKITCFKTGEETGGLNKICRYDCVGNLVTTTVGAAQMCPIQIQR